MTHEPIIDYFKYCNEQLVDFSEDSFFRMDLSEITGSFRRGITFPALVVESPEGDMDNSSLSSSVIGRVFAFTVYDKHKKGDFQDQNQKLDNCEKIGLKIIARMRHDARNPDHLLYNRFKVNTVNFVKVGPVFSEHLYGYRFTGVIEAEESLLVKPEDWNDINQVCH